MNVVVAGITVVTPILTEKGWPFANAHPFPGAEVDKLNGASYLREIYLKAEPSYSGRYVDAIITPGVSEGTGAHVCALLGILSLFYGIPRHRRL